MEQQTNIESYRLSIGLITISRLFERTGFYGIRGVFLIFLMGSPLYLTVDAAIPVYSQLIIYGSLGTVIGAVVGDFAFGPKNTILAGLLLEAIGAFLISANAEGLLELSVLLFSIGSGMAAPNYLALLARNSRSHTEKSNAVFSLFYAFINLGALASMFVPFLFGEKNYQLTFFACGLVILFSALPILFVRQLTIENHPRALNTSQISGLVFALIAGAAFWYLYESANDGVIMTYSTIGKVAFEEGITGSTGFVWTLQPGATVIAGVVFFFIWNSVKMNDFLKIGIGFLLTALSFILIMLISTENPGTAHVYVMALAILISAVGEVLLAPVIMVIITKYAIARFYALFFAASIVLGMLVKKLLGSHPQNSSMSINEFSGTSIMAVFVMIVIGIVVTVVHKSFTKK